MKPTICFGEIMGRFSPLGYQRIAQAMPGRMEMTFAGAEANAAVAIARLGGAAEFVTALPCNSIADASEATLRAAGVGVERSIRREVGRFGMFFVESGANQRGGLVIYDRENSTFALSGPEIYPWDRILAGAGWFHTSGIAAGVSAAAAGSTRAAVTAAKRAGITVSCDVNFRRKLWQWQPGTAPADLCRQTLQAWLPDVDVLISNPYDLAALAGQAFTDDPSDFVACSELARKVGKQLSHLRWIAMTLRQNHSASRNSWGALLLRPADGALFSAPLRNKVYAPYVIDMIVDRVGTGDAFAGALIHALQTPRLAEPSHAIAFATATGCLAHSVFGDFFQGTLSEVESLVSGNESGHVAR